MLLFINIIYIYMMCIYMHTYMDMYIFSHWFFNVSPLLASIFNRLLLKFSGPVWTLIASLKGSDTAAWLHSATCWTSRGTRPPSIEGDDDSNIFNRQIGTQPLPCARQWAGPRDIFKWQLHTLQGSASQVYLNSVQFSRSVVSDSLRPHESQHARPSCPSPTPRVYSNSHPWSRWCHPAISSAVVPFSSCPQSLPASGSFPTSQLFPWGGQSIGSFSFSISPSNEHPGLISFRWTGWISSQSKGLSRVFSNTTVQKHQFFGAQLSL